MVDCIIDGNLAGQGGAVNTHDSSHARLEGCALSNNRVDITGGGGLMADTGSSVELDGCLVSQNQRRQPGGEPDAGDWLVAG